VVLPAPFGPAMIQQVGMGEILKGSMLFTVDGDARVGRRTWSGDIPVAMALGHKKRGLQMTRWIVARVAACRRLVRLLRRQGDRNVAPPWSRPSLLKHRVVLVSRAEDVGDEVEDFFLLHQGVPDPGHGEDFGGLDAFDHLAVGGDPSTSSRRGIARQSRESLCRSHDGFRRQSTTARTRTTFSSNVEKIANGNLFESAR
jgi:hypothetical protein